MFVLILLILLVLLTMGVVALIFNKQDAVYIAVSALAADTAVYAVISKVLYIIKKYTIERSLLASAMIALIIMVVLIFMKRRITYSFSIKKNIIPVMMIVILAIVSFFVIKSGYYGASDKAGAVQGKAMKFKDEYYIYGLTDDEYYQNIYSPDELENVKQILEPLEQKQKDADTGLASVMALIGALFGYEAMDYTYVYLLALAIYSVYIIGEFILEKKQAVAGLRHINKCFNINTLVSMCITAVSVAGIIILFGAKDVAVSWNELNQIDRISNETSAYVIDKDMLDELYIPVKCMTMGYIIPETGNMEADERRFFIPEDNELKDCSNFNIITSGSRFEDEYMESLLLNRAYNERYCIYRNSWRYYYDGNYENADISCNYFYLGIVLIGIIVLMYAIAAVICRYRHKKADFIVCGMGAVGLYAIVYTAIMNVLISGFSEYTGSLFYSGIILGTLFSILLSCIALCFTGHIAGELQDIDVRYHCNAVSIFIIVISVVIIFVINNSMAFSSGIADGTTGNIQVSAVSYITGNVINQDMVVYEAVHGFDRILASWMVFTGGIMGIRVMTYAYAVIAIITGMLAGVIIYCITDIIILKKDKENNAGENGRMALTHVLMVLSYIFMAFVMSAGFNYTSDSDLLYKWNNIDIYMSDIKGTDIVVADKDVNPALTGIMKAVRNVRIIRNDNMDTDKKEITVLGNAQKLAGINGNQIFYITQTAFNTKNTDFILSNNVEYSSYNLDIYQKYRVINKNDEFCIYKIDRLVTGKEVAQ